MAINPTVANYSQSAKNDYSAVSDKSSKANGSSSSKNSKAQDAATLKSQSVSEGNVKSFDQAKQLLAKLTAQMSSNGSMAMAAQGGRISSDLPSLI